MNAKLKPLEGKYYGSTIEITLDDGTINEIKVWVHDESTCSASERELKNAGYKTTDEACEDGWICDSHYESAICYKICCKIVDVLNSP